MLAMRLGLISIAACLLHACAAKQYIPEESVIAKGRIAPFGVSGDVVVDNVQARDGWIPWNQHFLVNRHLMAETLKEQLHKEIGLNGVKSGSAEPKAIKVSVQEMHSLPSTNPFISTMGGTMTVAVQLGDGRSLTKRVESQTLATSPEGAFARLWNGAIALVAIDILSDAEVRKYLAAGPGPGTSTGAPSQSPRDLEARLLELKRAFAAGLLTKDEYEAKRKSLLESL